MISALFNYVSIEVGEELKKAIYDGENSFSEEKISMS